MKAEMFNAAFWVSDTDPSTLDTTYSAMLNDAGFNVIAKADHHFNPQGYTALYLLSESHLAIHTFPEEGRTYVELSSCVRAPYDAFMAMADGIEKACP